MTPERWERIKELFATALDQDPAARSVFLRETCQNDETLRAEVERLLFEHGRTGTFLDSALERVIGPLPGTKHLFSEHQVVAERFRIVRFIGQGGMGEVYEAEDLALQERVALKTIRPEIAADARALARFKQEIHLARKITHPNICRVFDLASHKMPALSGEGPHEILLLTMELLEGETLAAQLHRVGHMSTAEAMPIACQMAEALGAAHRVNIIHRDFKSANVVLAPQKDGNIRAVITDFGLARRVASEDSALSLSSTGHLVGTPDYMAPEQLEGLEATPASDVYALGVVLFEMLAGKRPFEHHSPFVAAFRRMSQPAPSPKLQAGELEPPWEAVILRCLERQPERRFAMAEEVGKALRGEAVTPSQRISEPGGAVAESRKRRWPAFAALSALLAGLVVVWSLLPHSRHKISPEALRWYAEGVNALADGTYLKASNMLERAIAADSQFPMAHVRLADAWGELDYSDRAKEEMLKATALAPDPSTLEKPEALALQAMNLSLTHDFAGAIVKYQEIAKQAAEPDKPRALVELGRAYEKNEEPKKALQDYREAGKRDPQYAAAFLRQGIVSGRMQSLPAAMSAFQEAASLYRAKSNFEGLAEALFQRGALLNRVGKVAEARVPLEECLQITGTTGNQHQQVRALLHLSIVSRTEGDSARAQELALRAVTMARANAMENLATSGLLDLGNAYFVRDDYARAGEYFTQALEFARRHKGRLNEARALLSLGSLRLRLHDADGGLRYVQEAIPFYHMGGYRKQYSQALILLGQGSHLKGDYEGALKAYREQLQVSQQVGDSSLVAVGHDRIGKVLQDQEQYVEALHHFEQAHEINKSLGNQQAVASKWVDRADMLWRLGRTTEARSALQEGAALTKRPEKGPRPLLTRLYVVGARMALSERRLSEAVSTSRQALASADSQDKRSRVEARAVEGLALTLENRAAQGLPLCRQAVEEATGAGDRVLFAGTQLVLAEALLHAGRFQEARDIAREATQQFGRSGQPESEWRALLIAGLASQRLADATSARESLDRASRALSALQQKWGAAASESYMKRPDIQSYSNQLISPGAQQTKAPARKEPLN